MKPGILPLIASGFLFSLLHLVVKKKKHFISVHDVTCLLTLDHLDLHHCSSADAQDNDVWRRACGEEKHYDVPLTLNVSATTRTPTTTRHRQVRTLHTVVASLLPVDICQGYTFWWDLHVDHSGCKGARSFFKCRRHCSLHSTRTGQHLGGHSAQVDEITSWRKTKISSCKTEHQLIFTCHCPLVVPSGTIGGLTCFSFLLWWG